MQLMIQHDMRCKADDALSRRFADLLPVWRWQLVEGACRPASWDRMLAFEGPAQTLSGWRIWSRAPAAARPEAPLRPVGRLSPPKWHLPTGEMRAISKGRTARACRQEKCTKNTVEPKPASSGFYKPDGPSSPVPVQGFWASDRALWKDGPPPWRPPGPATSDAVGPQAGAMCPMAGTFGQPGQV